MAMMRTTMTSIAMSGKALIGFMTGLGSSLTSLPNARARVRLEGPINRRRDLGDLERLAGDLAERARVDEEFVAEHGLELAGVHLGNEDMLKPPE